MNGRLRIQLLMLSDALCVGSCWAVSVFGYRTWGIGHYKFGAEYYLRMWSVVVAFLVVNWLLRLYHGRIGYPNRRG